VSSLSSGLSKKLRQSGFPIKNYFKMVWVVGYKLVNKP